MGELDTCMLCPRLCRSACPVATGTGREAATPSWIATVVRAWERGTVSEALAREAVALCTDCGACQEHCHLHRPLPELLRRARASLDPRPLPEPPPPPDGQALLVVADDRQWDSVRERVGADAVWRVPSRFGEEAVRLGERHPPAWVEALRARRIITPDGGIATVMRLHDLPYVWVADELGDPGCGSCAHGGGGPLACCGAAGPLARVHPPDAVRVARTWARRGGLQVQDARCRAHLRAAGVEATDVLDREER